MNVEEAFSREFGEPPAAAGNACGRVNLIGEHLDYNGGMVLPTAIDKQVRVALHNGRTDADEIYSATFKECSLRPIDGERKQHWSDYVAGALSKARQLGLLDGGMRVAVQSNIPYGAGVSSSAAVIIATLRAAHGLAGKSPDSIELAKWAQAVEHSYIGMPCGIMDQMAVAVAEPGRALALDTRTLDYSLVTLPDDYHFAVLFSGVGRKLDEGRYAQRRQECELAAKQLGVPYLCLMTDEQYANVDQLPAPLNMRARHTFTEQARVTQAVHALQSQDIASLGLLMTESHVSMRDDFEISVPEIDAMVLSALEFGAIGARLTGGGFGGCIVACVPKHYIVEWWANMESAYEKSTFVC